VVKEVHGGAWPPQPTLGPGHVHQAPAQGGTRPEDAAGGRGLRPGRGLLGGEGWHLVCSRSFVGLAGYVAYCITVMTAWGWGLLWPTGGRKI